MNRHICFRVAAAMAASLATSCVFAATIVVNSTSDVAADDGQCTLREALDAATNNVASGATNGECAAGEPLPIVDTIEFAIPGGGVRTIQPTATMPPIREAVVIDGYTQP